MVRSDRLKRSNKGPRQHHIVPASFLALFALPQSKDGRLYVWDKEKIKMWPSTPRKAGRERDYYKMEGPNDPATAENALQEIETVAMPVLRRILASGCLPDNDELDAVILFIAVLEARGRAIRLAMEDFVERSGRIMLELTASNEKLWAAATAKVISSGFDPNRVPRPEVLLSALREKRIRIRSPQNMKLNWIAYSLSTLFPLLRQREWILVQAAKRTRVRFITSDRPAVLAWSKPRPPSPYGIGYGLSETEVSVPIGPSSMLLGRYEALPTPVADDGYVATINSRTFNRAVKNLFSPEQDFALWTERGFLAGSHVFDKVARGRPETPPARDA